MRVISRPLSKTAKRASSNGIDQTLQAIGLAAGKKTIRALERATERQEVGRALESWTGNAAAQPTQPLVSSPQTLCACGECPAFSSEPEAWSA
jgi:hypothetical protein